MELHTQMLYIDVVYGRYIHTCNWNWLIRESRYYMVNNVTLLLHRRNRCMYLALPWSIGPEQGRQLCKLVEITQDSVSSPTPRPSSSYTTPGEPLYSFLTVLLSSTLRTRPSRILTKEVMLMASLINSLIFLRRHIPL